MALPGMKSTADFVTDERPKNYRAGLLLLSPRNGAPLFSLTAAMSSQSVNDPEFKWWEEALQMYNFKLGNAALIGDTTLTLQGNAKALKPGDMLIVESSGERVRVATVVSDTSITISRAFGPGGTPAGTAAAIANGVTLMYAGSSFREGSPRPVGTSFAPTQKSNVTQIFRDAVEWTRTATQTEYRTGDPKNNDRRRTLHKHALGIERALWTGTRYETIENGQPLRTTDGVLNFIPASNVSTVQGAGGKLDLDELEALMPKIFAFGSKEKVAFVSLNTLAILGAVVRKNSQYNWGPTEKEYGLDVQRLRTPAGTLTLTEMPLFAQGNTWLANDMVVMDTANLKYRYMMDTRMRKDVQQPGDDGVADEWTTECGLEVHHGQTFYWLKGILGAQKDD